MEISSKNKPFFELPMEQENNQQNWTSWCSLMNQC
jgi:hypothetical protein